MYLFEDSMLFLPNSTCVTDVVAPTFAGITGLINQPQGNLRASWSAGSDALAPVLKYNVYVKLGTATGLFSSSNYVGQTSKLYLDIFTLFDDSFIAAQGNYFVGVRAWDGFQEDNNLISMNLVANGLAPTAVSFAVWDELKAAHVTPGTFGSLLDAKVSDVKTDTAAIKVQTDKFAFDGSLRVMAHTVVNDDKTGYELTPAEEADIAAQVADSVWDELTAGHVAAGSFGARLQAVPDAAANGAAVWEQTLVAHNTAGSFGAKVQAAPDALAIASAVWDALLVDYNDVGSFGAKVQAGITVDFTPITPTLAIIQAQTDKLEFDVDGNVYAHTVLNDDKTGYDLSPAARTAAAAVVWDVPIASHLAAGSVGEALMTASTGGVPSITIQAIADAVWDELLVGHTISGSAGVYLATRSSSNFGVLEGEVE